MAPCGSLPAPSTFSTNAVRNCSVPAGKSLFFPMINVECSTLEAPPFYGANEEQLRSCAKSFKFKGMFATVDGVPLPNVGRYQTLSPLFKFSLPKKDVLGLGPAEEGESVSSGYYLMLAPLSPGKHVVSFGGTYPDFDFSIAITYNLTVGQ